MLERDVEKEIRIYAEGRGMITLKLSGPGNRGKPDRLFFYRGRVLIMEVKKPSEKPTKLQQQWLTTFRDADFDAVWADRPGLGKTLIDKFITKTDAERGDVPAKAAEEEWEAGL
jgi:hypothetical protein